MKCYRPIKQLDDDRTIGFFFSPHQGKRPSPWPEGKRTRQIRHIDTGEFNGESKKIIKDHWVIFNPDVKELPDVLGSFGPNEQRLLAIRRELKEAIELEDPGLCDFAKIDKLYDLRHHRTINEPQYYFVAVRNKKKSIDLDLTETGIAPYGVGITRATLLSGSRVKSSSLEGPMLWRDIETHEVLCNDRFKTLVESVGCVGMRFIQIPTL